MSQVTTHVLDLATGRPAAGVAVVLERVGGVGGIGRSGDSEAIASARTGTDGRIADLGPDALAAGTYRLRFDTGTFHGGTGFYPEVAIAFEVAAGGQHYHVPLLLGPWGYTTYRGS
jgi:5-hydroxyisourate hydrolase